MKVFEGLKGRAVPCGVTPSCRGNKPKVRFKRGAISASFYYKNVVGTAVINNNRFGLSAAQTPGLSSGLLCNVLGAGGNAVLITE